MPSSTSNFESVGAESMSTAAMHAHASAPGLRLTASDRPGMAQPVPERDIPPQPWRVIAPVALLLALLLLAVWESHWRAYGAVPGYRNSDGHWAEQRRRIDRGEGGKTVLIGSSRVLFDVQLPVWAKATGTAPIQLALEGTSPMSVLEDLANDQDFTGRLLIGVTPGLFFTGRENRGSVLAYYRDQGPSQRSGHWLSQRFIEPYAAFYDPDFALAKVIQRLPWPKRPGLEPSPPVRKLMVQGEGRNSRMWQKVETDPSYQAMTRAVWMARRPKAMGIVEAQAIIDAQIARAVAATAKLRARGVPVVFLRAPSLDPIYAGEERDFPRAVTWNLLLRRTGAPGIHFMDHPELQGYVLPEWSHLAAEDADRFTAALVPLVEQKFAAPL
jgi:hypothetical protein